MPFGPNFSIKFENFVVDNCNNDGIKLNAIVDSGRPTTNKNVIISEGYRLIKVDTLDNRAVSETIIQKISDYINKVESDSVIFSDFRHGIFNQDSIKTLTSHLGEKTFKVADSQVATRWGNISDFKKFDLITPNEREVRFSLADQDSSIGRLSAKLRKETKFSNLILKLGPKGILCCGSEDKNEYFTLDSFSSKIIDAVGAGDALLAYSTLVYLKTKSLLISGIIGSFAAGCECEIDGNVPIKTADILAKIDNVEKISKYTST
jgi:bifunctional ADP-heptose synthase (sugar kinase/adenylyltransferase)